MSDNPDKYIFERRKFIRIDSSFIAYYAEVGTEPPHRDAGQAKNISGGGILFITDKEYPNGTILKIKIKLPDIAEYIEIKTKVVNSVRKVKNLIYETSAQFIGIKEEDKQAIKDIVDSHLKGQAGGR